MYVPVDVRFTITSQPYVCGILSKKHESFQRTEDIYGILAKRQGSVSNCKALKLIDLTKQEECKQFHLTRFLCSGSFV